MKAIRQNLWGLAIISGFITVLIFVQAQTAVCAPSTFTNVNLTALSVTERAALLAAIEELPTVPAESVPPFGNFYSAAHLGQWPPLPGNINNLPVWDLGDGIYLLADQDFDYAALEEQTTAMRQLSRSMGLEMDSQEAAGNGYAIDTNDLWLEITSFSDGAAWFNLHHATNQVYEIWSKTDLLAPAWNIEQEVWPTNGEGMPFIVPQLARTNLFIWARDWTGITSGGNETPEWWFWKYFGTTDLSDTNLDSQGNTLLYDYRNGLDPNIISYLLEFTNYYFNTSPIYGTVSVQSGEPFYEAVLINDTNTADAIWLPYTSSNVTANLDSGNGIYTVLVGLRGLPADAQPNWQQATISLNNSPLTLAITNPAGSTVSTPMIQVQGYASGELSALSYDVSNAAGIFTNQIGGVTGEFYDTNLMEFTTNYFQCHDVALAAGLNTITLHATDIFSDTASANFNVILDYSTKTNPPALNILWPQNGTFISGGNFTLRAQVDDDTATVTASIAGQTIIGVVERSGQVWVKGLPVSAGTNVLTVTATDAAGNTTTTNLTVVQSPVVVTMDPLSSDQANQPYVTVTGTISDPSGDVCIFVNGMKAYYLDDEGDWEADGVPVSVAGTATFDIELYTGDPVNVGSEEISLPQPPFLILGKIKQNDNWGGLTSTVQWDYASGGYWSYDNLNSAIAPDDTNYTPPTVQFSVPPDFYNGEFSPNWQNAAVSAEVNGVYIYGNLQTTPMIVPGGQTRPGGTSLYLVTASAMTFSDLWWDDEIGLPAILPWDLSGADDTPVPPEEMQINGQPLANSGITNDDGSATGIALISAPSAMPVPLKLTASYADAYIFNMQACEIFPPMTDANRNGNFAPNTPATPYRFWINDSAESGDIASGSDAQIPESSSPNYNTAQVQGNSDLVNFFPVVLSLSNVFQWLPPFTRGVEYRLEQDDEAVKFIYTSLSPANAYDCLTNTASYGYGANGDEWATNADTITVSNAPGTMLDPNWLAQLGGNGGNGVILVEGCAATTKPLWLEIWKDGQLLGGVPLYLSINGVEQMFRHLNLCAYGNGTVDVNNPSRTSAPNEPITNGKNLVFLPGYNVNQQQSRGVESEIFKRFYWSRSKAKFYGVTWNGAVSQGDMSLGGEIPQLVDVTCNYQTNVVNAMQTASHLADFLNNGLLGETTVAAHSLGNMVVLSAISDYSAAPSHYFMIDAAVPIEAVQGNEAREPAMIYSTWQDYSNRLYASDWWQLFTNGDARSTLTWSNRLGNLGSVDIYNFYSSPGEEVLREDTDDPPSGILSGGATQIINYYGASVPFGTYVWVWQEKGKGTAAHDWFIGSTHGGWKFNDYWGNPPPSPAIMNDTAASTLQDYPMFSVGSTENGPPDQDLRSDEYGSGYAQANRDRILSDAIPALTLPVGANFVLLFDERAAGTRNFNMQSKFETGWPAERFTSGEKNNNWQHSDYDVVAYPFIHKLFEEIVNDGNLK